MKLYEKITYVILFVILLNMIIAAITYNFSAFFADITALIGWGNIAVREHNDRIRNETISG